MRELLTLVRSIVYGAFGWLVFFPLSFAIPKKARRIAVIGRYDGEFADNAKYFFLQSGKLLQDLELAFITERGETQEALSSLGLRAYRYPSLKSFLFLIQSSVVVVDSNEWAAKFRRFICAGARLIQLWHGVGFKRIQLNRIHNEVAAKSWLSIPAIIIIRRIIHIISGKRIVYDLVLSTSKFYKEQVFERSFLSRNFVAYGYPRNTFGTDLIDNEALWIGADHALYLKCKEWRAKGRKVILIMPTFRDSGKHPMELDARSMRKLDEACSEHGFECLFKFHPYEKNANKVSGRHLHIVRCDSDIYPVIPLTNALITDYSSIYTDYSLIDKPEIFFVPDLEEYVKNDRQFQFDYDAMTPGPKVKTWDELIEQVISSVEEDLDREQRHRIRRLAFDDHEQSMATRKILDFAQKNSWLG